ncbi:conjugal transfer protein TraG [Lampropedia puyangensis]|uniref:Conjugal transfer protein TraG n=1 Tax=Lampropedia puyangensis TaxID=1330072 RepID=A0A4S8EXP9_9BURK|nr:conjugal transfer protein TraG N-terminal domain-containing protein [Lampropedia puyangensis]THT98413.1 conjugal transfer protein TraG [Lampropedia puyangensis]
MEVGSYLEIFLTGYGWGLANIIAGVIASTGLVMIPFIWIILKTWKDAKERGEEGVGISSIVDTILVRIGVALFVFTLCFLTTPITSLGTLTYNPRPTAMDPNPSPASNTGGTQSTYDSAMGSAFDQSYSIDPQPQLTNVPMWWYSVMSIASGVNGAVIGSMSNRMSELRELEDVLRTTTIEDSRVIKPMQAFRSACFNPARSKFLETTHQGTPFSSTGAGILSDDPKDAEWIGSLFFNNEPGYYDSLRAPFPVTGFPINCSRDVDYHACSAGSVPYTGAVVDPEWGRPTCKEWWLTSDTGLRDSMVSAARTDGIAWLVSTLGTEQMKNNVAQSLSYQANPQYVMNIGSQTQGASELSWGTKAGRWVAGLAGSPKLFMEGLTSAATMRFLMALLPMIQALVLMGLYMFLPMVVFLSGFNLSIMFTGAIAIFTVKFWSAMWEVAFWIDARLMQAMYGGTQIENVAKQFVYAWEDGSLPGEKRILLNIMLMVMFVGFPMIWSGMMAWAGAHMSTVFGNFMTSGSSLGRSVGQSGASNVVNGITTASKVAGGAGGKVAAVVSRASK